MNTSARIVSCHLFLAREGASFSVPTSGTVGQESKPGSADTVWAGPGKIQNFEFKASSDVREIFAGRPGRRVRVDAAETNMAATATWECLEIGPLSAELGFKTGPLTGASTQFNPLASGNKKFWVKVQGYDQSESLVFAMDLFGLLRCPDGFTFDDNYVKPKMELTILDSTLQTGTL